MDAAEEKGLLDELMTNMAINKDKVQVRQLF
jgi:hypothetical protein